MKWNAILDSIAWGSSQTTGQRSEVVSVESVLALVVDLHLFEAPASVPASVGGSSIAPASYLHLLEVPVKCSEEHASQDANQVSMKNPATHTHWP